MIGFPDGTLKQERELCREELELAQWRYTEARSPETRAAYMRALKMFADLVVYRPKDAGETTPPSPDVRERHSDAL
jgi:hypothetical protein